MQVPRHTGFSAPTLVRALARLADADIPEPTQSLPDRLSQWLGWTDAIALSSALKSAPKSASKSASKPAPNGRPAAASGARVSSEAAAREYERVRDALTRAITGASASATADRRRLVVLDDAVDFGTYRQRYLALQQAMEMDIGRLRGRLRAMLAAGTSGMARLAAVDAVMEQVLGVREHNLLALVPGQLERYFERLRRTAEAVLAEAEVTGAAAAMAPGAWLGTFRADMRRVLLAELEIRLQPVEGLLAALRAS